VIFVREYEQAVMYGLTARCPGERALLVAAGDNGSPDAAQ
jgi:hypothetical protein